MSYEKQDKARERSKHWRADHPQETNDRSKRWREANPDRWKEIQARSVQKRKIENPTAYRDKWRRSIAKRKGYVPPPPERDCPAMSAHCDICAGSSHGGRPLDLDHCHTTGRFRGWLCSNCNTSLSGIDRVGIEKFATYLGRTR